MHKVNVDELFAGKQSKYALVVGVAKRAREITAEQEVSEEDVAKQVKETLARLTSKGKNKGAKYRKEKRDMDGAVTIQPYSGCSIK